MHTYAPQVFNYIERIYRVVAVNQNGERTVISKHDSFLQAERRRQVLPSEEGLELRIETSRK